MLALIGACDRNFLHTSTATTTTTTITRTATVGLMFLRTRCHLLSSNNFSVPEQSAPPAPSAASSQLCSEAVPPNFAGRSESVSPAEIGQTKPAGLYHAPRAVSTRAALHAPGRPPATKSHIRIGNSSLPLRKNEHPNARLRRSPARAPRRDHCPGAPPPTRPPALAGPPGLPRTPRFPWSRTRFVRSTVTFCAMRGGLLRALAHATTAAMTARTITRTATVGLTFLHMSRYLLSLMARSPLPCVAQDRARLDL